MGSFGGEKGKRSGSQTFWQNAANAADAGTA